MIGHTVSCASLLRYIACSSVCESLHIMHQCYCNLLQCWMEKLKQNLLDTKNTEKNTNIMKFDRRHAAVTRHSFLEFSLYTKPTHRHLPTHATTSHSRHPVLAKLFHEHVVIYYGVAVAKTTKRGMKATTPVRSPFAQSTGLQPRVLYFVTFIFFSLSG